MQRVADELLSEFEQRSDLTLHQIVLRSTWRSIHFRVFPFLVTSYFRLRRLIAEDQVDVVLFSSMVTALLAIPLNRVRNRHNTRMLAIVHGLDITTPSRFYQALVRRVFGKIDLILPVSQATADACIQRELAQERVQVVHNGVDIRRFDNDVDVQGSREDLSSRFLPENTSLPADAFLLCSVGRLVKRKGFAWFIKEVMPLLPDNVHYWIGGDGPEGKAIRGVIEASGMTGRVRAWGKITEEQLHTLYRCSDLFLMPNIQVPGDMEGFGIVMLEAGMNGLPTVASRLEGILEVIRDGENGTSVDSRDAEGFAAAIMRYLDDHTYHASARLRAREYTESTFGWKNRADRYLSICAGTERAREKSELV